MPGFRITANQVTLARLIPMPLLTWWVYEGMASFAAGGSPNQLWAALVIGTIIGSTDFVDGWMARRAGPTVLGGLLDPIADKVFVAFAYVPFADMGLIPAWACALMFVREFLVTALRSAYEQRDVSLKTSYLGKMKTWTQMQGIGVMLLFPLIGDRPLMRYIIWAGVILPVVAMAALWIVRRRVWFSALIMSGSFVLLLLVHMQGDNKFALPACMIAVVAITWVSAFDYFAVGFKQLRGRGDLTWADGVRVLSSITIPALVFTALVESPAPAWALIAVITLELAVGGLDNLLSHHKVASSATAWGLRSLGASALLVGAVLVPAQATAFAAAAAGVSLIGVAWEFWRSRDWYVDARLRNKAMRASPSA